eukprot:g2090.t1
MTTNPKPIVKDWRFYRRTGATWTDLYHTPTHRLKLSGYRPDLDKLHEERVRKRTIEDEKKEAEKIRKHRERILLTQERRHRRQQVNILRAKMGRGEVDRQVAEEELAKQEGQLLALGAGKQLPAVKDHSYYRRTGNLWTDVAHVPAERLHLVMDSKMLRADVSASENIRKRFEYDLSVEEEKERKKIERVHQIRNDFLSRLAKKKLNVAEKMKKKLSDARRKLQDKHKEIQTKTEIKKQRPISAYSGMPELKGMPTQDPLVVRKLKISIAQGRQFGTPDLNEEIRRLVSRNTTTSKMSKMSKSDKNVKNSISNNNEETNSSNFKNCRKFAFSWSRDRISKISKQENVSVDVVRERVEAMEELDDFEKRLNNFKAISFTRPKSAAYNQTRRVNKNVYNEFSETEEVDVDYEDEETYESIDGNQEPTLYGELGYSGYEDEEEDEYEEDIVE